MLHMSLASYVCTLLESTVPVVQKRKWNLRKVAWFAPRNRVRKSWVLIPALLLNVCVTVGKAATLSEPVSFSSLRTEIIITSLSAPHWNELCGLWKSSWHRVGARQLCL